MNEREQWLRLIEADPEDDTVRLVLADWLEEHGEEDRARFIRLQRVRFVEDAAAIRAVAPLDTLRLRLLKGWEKAVLASEQLSGVSRLWVYAAQLADAGILSLAANPHLRRLRKLDTSRELFPGDNDKHANKLTDASAVALARTRNLPALVSLDLNG
jgi:uncharacterized protein (TIGR02996 family)